MFALFGEGLAVTLQSTSVMQVLETIINNGPGSSALQKMHAIVER